MGKTYKDSKYRNKSALVKHKHKKVKAMHKCKYKMRGKDD
jgi:hypothetical protein